MHITKFQLKVVTAPLILCIVLFLSGWAFPLAAMAAKLETRSGSTLKNKHTAPSGKSSVVVHTFRNPLHAAFGSTMNTKLPTKRYSKVTKGFMKKNAISSPSDLEENLSQWNIYHDQGFTDGTLTSVSNPSMDGAALQVQMGAGQPYAGVQAYRNMASDDNAKSFSLDTSFYFSDATPIQALEFTMSTWVKGQRYEWALQWQVVQDGGPQQGLAQSWRLWNGSRWVNTGSQQILAPNTWHTLNLHGVIDNGRVHYSSFNCDTVKANLTNYSFAPVSSADNDKVAVGAQLDGNAFETPYNITLEQVHLSEG
jgi:hypothetical protein